MLVNDDEIGDVICATGVDQLLDDGSATVDALRVWKHCLQLLLPVRVKNKRNQTSLKALDRNNAEV